MGLYSAESDFLRPVIIRLAKRSQVKYLLKPLAVSFGSVNVLPSEVKNEQTVVLSACLRIMLFIAFHVDFISPLYLFKYSVSLSQYVLFY